MLISYNLLSWLHPELKSWTINEIDHALFKLGIEINKKYSLKTQTTIKPVIIEEINPIIESNNLTLCLVVDAQEQKYKIICGAKNIRVGMPVLLALPGAILNHDAPLKTRTFLNKYKSDGMLLSLKELAPWINDLLEINSKNSLGLLEITAKEWEYLAADIIWDCTLTFDKEYLKTPYLLGLNILAHSSSNTNIKKSYTEAELLIELKNTLNKYTQYSEQQTAVKIISPNTINNFENLKPLFIMNNVFWNNKNIEDYLNLIAHSFSLNYFIKLDHNLGSPNLTKNHCLLLAIDFLKHQQWNLNLNYAQIPNTKFIDYKNLYFKFCKYNQLTFNDQQLIDIFQRLIIKGFNSKVSDENLLLLSPPTWYKNALSFNLEDYYNEFFSFIDWDTVPELIPNLTWHPIDNSFIDYYEIQRQKYLQHNFFECQTYNLQPLSEVQNTNFLFNPESLSLLNTLNPTKNTLRFNALHQLLQVYLHNQSQQNEQQSLFEINTFPINQTTNFWVNLLIPQKNHQFPYNNSGYKYDLIDIKAIIKTLIPDVEFISTTSGPKQFNQNCCFEIKTKQKNIGYLGQLSVDILLEYKLLVSTPIIYVGYKLIPVLLNFPQPKNYSLFPASYQNFSIVVPFNFSLQNLLKKINDLPLVELIKIKEKYQINSMLSVLLSVRISASNKTLTTSEIQSTISQINSIIQNFDLVIR